MHDIQSYTQHIDRSSSPNINYESHPQNEEVEDKANAVLPAGLLAQLEDPKWKDRLEACGKFKEVH